MTNNWTENKRKAMQGLVPLVDAKIQNETIECCVCLEETKRKTSCGHPLCGDCIRIIVKGVIKRDAICPLCRRDLICDWKPFEEKCKPETKKTTTRPRKPTRPRGRPKKNVKSVGTAGMTGIGL
tara:strand:+ start:317 stop:688 length:372 start_codon:yes stop_codon:yes gene_type:complete